MKQLTIRFTDKQLATLDAIAIETSSNRNAVVLVGPDEGLQLRCVLNLDTPELLLRSKFVEFINAFPIDRWHERCDVDDRCAARPHLLDSRQGRRAQLHV